MKFSTFQTTFIIIVRRNEFNDTRIGKFIRIIIDKCRVRDNERKISMCKDRASLHQKINLDFLYWNLLFYN